MSLLKLFCAVDDFWQEFRPEWEKQLIEQSVVKRKRKPRLTKSEIMTIVIHFHQSHYRNFKAYYKEYVMVHLCTEFPKLVSYQRFVELMPRIDIPLMAYFQHCTGACTGIAFIDATSLKVCHKHQIIHHRVFKDWSERGKTSMDWFYGFKLHLVVNERRGELLAFDLTPGNVDDRQPVPDMTVSLFGKRFGDHSYIPKSLFEQLFEHGLQLITSVRKNMKNRLMILEDKLLLRKRSIIESINDQLKNISQIEHTRHRSANNFFVNVVAGLIAYCHQDKKPSLN